MADWWDQFSPENASANTGVSGYAPGGQPMPQAAPQTNVPTDPQAFFNSLFPGESVTPDQLKAAEQQLAAQGIKVLTNAKGISAKIQLPNGQIVDVIQGAEAGLNKKQWLTGPSGNLGSLGYGFGSSMAPWTGTFRAPTAEDALNSPGAQYAMDNAWRMMQNGAAAKGTLLNARAQEGMLNSLGGALLQQYGDIYNRSMGEHMLKRDDFFQNQDRPWAKQMNLAQLGRPV